MSNQKEIEHLKSLEFFYGVDGHYYKEAAEIAASLGDERQASELSGLANEKSERHEKNQREIRLHAKMNSAVENRDWARASNYAASLGLWDREKTYRDRSK